MQENLITTIDGINNKIFSIDSKTRVITPNLAAHIIFETHVQEAHFRPPSWISVGRDS